MFVHSHPYLKEILMNGENALEKTGFFEGISNFFRKELVQYIIKRILAMIPSLLLISFLIFVVIQLPPGDYVSAYIAKLQAQGEVMPPEVIAQLREDYGLDKPFLVQYWNWITGIIYTPSNTTWYRLYGSHHNWKYSFAYNTTVWYVIRQNLPLTVGLTLAVMIFQYLISIPLAVYSATHQYSFWDYVLSFIGFIGAAVPGFILAIICMILAYKWTGNPMVGLFSKEMIENGIHWGNLGEFLKRLIIPFIVLGLGGTCGTIRSIRAQMLDEISQPYTLTARAKGVSETKIIWKYCFRAAINPTVTGLGTSLSHLFSGSTVTAMVLNIQIMGPVLYEALLSQDMYLAGAIVMVQAFLVELGILLADIGLAFLDPRIRFSGGSR